MPLEGSLQPFSTKNENTLHENTTLISYTLVVCLVEGVRARGRRGLAEA